LMSGRRSQHLQMNVGALVPGESDVADFPSLFSLQHGLERSSRSEDALRVVIAYSPLGQGLLAGHAPPRPNAARRFRRLLGSATHGELTQLRAAVAEIAEAHGATMAQVALAWLISHPNVIAIPGARTLEQLESNVAAAELQLGADERLHLSNLAADLRARRGR